MEFSGERRTPDPFDLAALAARQHGVVAMRQLRTLGYSRWAVQRMVRRALLHPRYPGVYAVGHTRITIHGRWWAALLACGPTTVLSHIDAAALHSLRTVPDGDIHVIAAGKHDLNGLHVHTAALPDAHRTEVRGLPVTTIERTIADVAAMLPEQRLRTLIEQAMRIGTVDFTRLGGLAAERHGRPGGPALQAVLTALTDAAPRTHAGLEEQMLELIRRAGLPEPLVNHIVDGYEVDFHWPRQRLIVETDGWAFHRDRAAFERDRRRDSKLHSARWRVVRVTHERVTREPQIVIAELARMLTA